MQRQLITYLSEINTIACSIVAASTPVVSIAAVEYFDLFWNGRLVWLFEFFRKDRVGLFDIVQAGVVELFEFFRKGRVGLFDIFLTLKAGVGFLDIVLTAVEQLKALLFDLQLG